MATTKTFLLMHGTYEPTVVGAFATSKQAAEIKAALGEDFDGYSVAEAPVLSPDLTVDVLATVHSAMLGLHWDGRVRYDQVGTPRKIVRLGPLPADADTDEPETPPGECEVTVAPFEQDYTLGVTLLVEGTDPAQVAAAYAEQSAALTADPAAAVVVAWTARGEVPSWVWQRTENQGLVPALRAAGIQ